MGGSYSTLPVWFGACIEAVEFHGLSVSLALITQLLRGFFTFAQHLPRRNE